VKPVPSCCTDTLPVFRNLEAVPGASFFGDLRHVFDFPYGLPEFHGQSLDGSIAVFADNCSAILAASVAVA